MQRSDGRSDTDASTVAKEAESATEKYILGNKLEEIHLGEGTSHDGSFLKGLGEVLGNFPYLEEDNDEEELANFVAFIGITEFVEGEIDTDDDQSSVDGDDGISYQELCLTVVQIGKENLCLKKEKSWLEDTVINLRKELDDERKKEANTSDLKRRMKSDLGRTIVKSTQRSIHGGPRCSMTLVSEAVALISKDENPWYFHSGWLVLGQSASSSRSYARFTEEWSVCLVRRSCREEERMSIDAELMISIDMDARMWAEHIL
ncbi:hypothetical protein F2Q69_00004184 [Brassica cretica]|uniref:Uncharacterized protein n=1 Tax=Brassica cretica TaxID=69181 RepID=A0A8S9PFK2_BRACR|nr:hypothetical protein F2Q69_00004184 [Brassica cretica]